MCPESPKKIFGSPVPPHTTVVSPMPLPTTILALIRRADTLEHALAVCQARTDECFTASVDRMTRVTGALNSILDFQARVMADLTTNNVLSRSRADVDVLRTLLVNCRVDIAMAAHDGKAALMDDGALLLEQLVSARAAVASLEQDRAPLTTAPSCRVAARMRNLAVVPSAISSPRPIPPTQPTLIVAVPQPRPSPRLCSPVPMPSPHSCSPDIEQQKGRVQDIVTDGIPAATAECILGLTDHLSDFHSYKIPERPIQRYRSRPLSPLCRFLIFLSTFFLLVRYASAAQFFALPSSSFTIYALNANGAVDPLKMQSISAAILTHRPHAFVISETKTSRRVSSNLPNTEYDIYEEAAQPCAGSHLFKWGVVVGIRRGIQHDPPAVLPPPLRGRAVVIDLTLPTTCGSAFRHRFLGLYAPTEPWYRNSGPTHCTGSFWSAATALCEAAPDGSWSTAGDFNSTLTAFESVSPRSQGHNRYEKFIRDTQALDLWTSVEGRSPRDHWTSRSTTSDAGAGIIDRVAVSRLGVADAVVDIARKTCDHISRTNHRAILATIVPVPRVYPDRRPNFAPIAPVIYPSRLRFPPKAEKHRFATFASLVNAAVRESPSLASLAAYTDIADDADWTDRYTALTGVLAAAGAQAFGFYKKVAGGTRARDVPREAVVRYREARHIGGALCLLGDRDGARVSAKSREYLLQFMEMNNIPPEPRKALEQALKRRRRTVMDEAFTIRDTTARAAAKTRDHGRMKAVLMGASAKRLFAPAAFQGMPLVVAKPDGSGELLSSPADVMEAHRTYFAKLYARPVIPDMPKPWMTTPSVLDVRERVQADPFVWPVAATTDSFRAMIRRGNAGPSPGPDGWEKWTVKALGDYALTRVAALHNYEVMHSHFPDVIKDGRITSLHKRGLTTELSNKRGITISNFLHNSPFAFLTYLLNPYAARMGIVPETQVASQKGVQTRDLTSFLSAVQCFASRNQKTVYALQRDQMKGFDMLLPDGFYDAVTAYGLPPEIIALDKSAQSANRSSIRTAYGFTAPIVIDGVTKQGASLSPTKSVFTTSMGNRYLHDLFSNHKDAVCIRSMSASRGAPHVPDDMLKVLVMMIEATDDSFLLALTLETLRAMALVMERFQFTYNWMTGWPKSFTYALGPCPNPLPATVRIPSVSVGPGVDPLSITEHEVSLVHGSMTFLNVKINEPGHRTELIREIIDSFQLPAFSVNTPFTVVRRAYEAMVIPRARALLSLQPISASDAQELDSRAMQRVHMLSGLPYCPSIAVLTLPVDLHGLGWSSIARINAAQAVEGLGRDLNHHIAAYRIVARVSHADWMCQRNGCRTPLEGTGLERKFTLGLQSSIPAAWIVAREHMRKASPQLALRCTDMSFVVQGKISIEHALNLKKSAGQIPVNIAPTAVEVMRRRGMLWLSDVGTWSAQNGDLLFTAFTTYPVPRRNPVNADVGPARWLPVATALNGTSMCDLYRGPVDLLATRADRRAYAESFVRNVARDQNLPRAHDTVWASDGSMVPADARKHESRQVTAAVAGPTTLVLRLPSRSSSILHGEVMALTAAVLLARGDAPRVLSDHANSVNIVRDPTFIAGDETRIRRANGRSYYRWLRAILQDYGRANVEYTRGHQGCDTLEGLLNDAADHYATSAQAQYTLVPSAPIPTFFMDEYTFHTPEDGWLEGNIREHVAHFDSLATAGALERASPRMLTHFHDPTPPPAYPYIKAFHAYSAMIQLYARSGQLPTAVVMVERHDKSTSSTRCRLGCGHSREDVHHIFVDCPSLQHMRADAGRALRSRFMLSIAATDLALEVMEPLLLAAESFYRNDPCWPLKIAFYYYGQVPPVHPFIPKDAFTSSVAHKRFVHRIATDWHYAAIRLAGRIWGQVQRTTASNIYVKRRFQA